VVKRLRELIPKPRSRFIKVKCPECGNEQITFNKAATKVYCSVCGTLLAETSGGKILLKGGLIEELS